MKSIVNQLATMKMLLEDELQALLLLSSLLDSWETLVVSLSNSSLDGVIIMSQATSSLLNEEERRKETGESQTQTDALVTEGKGRQFNRKETIEVEANSGQERKSNATIVVRRDTTKVNVDS